MGAAGAENSGAPGIPQAPKPVPAELAAWPRPIETPGRTIDRLELCSPCEVGGEARGGAEPRGSGWSGKGGLFGWMESQESMRRARIEYESFHQLLPAAGQAMRALAAASRDAGLEPALLELVKIRASQI